MGTKKNILKAIIPTILIMISVLGILYSFNLQHETVHQMIFSQYGIPSRIEVGIFSGKAIPEAINLSRSDYMAMYSQHMAHESVQYGQVHILIVLLMIWGTMATYFLIINHEEGEKAGLSKGMTPVRSSQGNGNKAASLETSSSETDIGIIMYLNTNQGELEIW